MRHLPTLLVLATLAAAPAMGQDAESQVYAAAKTCSGLNAYIRNYPTGRFVSDAQQRFARECQPKAAAPAKAAPSVPAASSAPASTPTSTPAIQATAAPATPIPTLKKCTPRLVDVGATELPIGGDTAKLLQANNHSCAHGELGATVSATLQLCDGAPAKVRSAAVKGDHQDWTVYEIEGAAADQKFQSLGKGTGMGAFSAKDLGSDLVFLRVILKPYAKNNPKFPMAICSLSVEADPQ